MKDYLTLPTIKTLFLILSIIIFSRPLYPHKDIKVKLEFDKEVFRTDEQIEIVFSVVNDGTEDFSFYVYDEFYKTFFIDLKHSKNYQAELTFNFLKNNAYTPSFNRRTVILKPRESFSVKIILNEIYELKEVGSYYLVGFFSPDGMANRMIGITTERYKIFVKPPLPIEQDVTALKDEESEKKRALHSLPPYEIVKRMLNAKYKKDEEEYILYFDFERLINIFPSFSKRYTDAKTSNEKLNILERFRNYFVSYWGDQVISYKIVRSEIEYQEAKVIADVEFGIRNTSYKLRYNYYLYLSYDNIWYIYGYDVVNIK